jgi:RND family efflux transporter MFP subunit
MSDRNQLSKVQPRSIAIGLLALITTAALVSAQTPTAGPAQSTPQQKQILSKAQVITTGIVQSVQWDTQIVANGVIAAWQEAVVSARTSGLALTDIRVDVGAAVKKGQVLARFDDRAAKADVEQAQASLTQATVNAKQASLNRDRMTALRGTGAVSEEAILQAVTQAESTAAQVSLARAGLSQAQVRLENTIATAPDDGLISARSATLGQAFNVATELFRLIRQNRLEWRAEVAAQDLARVQVGQEVAMKLADGTTVAGRVRQIAPSLQANVRMGVVNIDLKPGSSAKPAMYAEGTIQTGRATSLVVPAESVVIRDGRSYVFVIQGDRVKRVLINAGRRNDTSVEVISGLVQAQVIAQRGAGFLSDGDLVQIASVAAGVSK